MKTQRLSDVIPYRHFIDQGVVDLRDEGVLKGYWLIGPSPDSCDPQTLLDYAEQLGRSPVHFRTGDAIQIICDRAPAPVPPALNYSHPAAALVAAEQRERFAQEEHWITPTRLYLSHQYAAPMERLWREFLLASSAPQQIRGHSLLRQYALGRFRAFEDATSGAAGVRLMTNSEMFHDLVHCINYRDAPSLLPAPHVRLNKAMCYERQINGLYPIVGGWYLRPMVVTLYPSPSLPQLLSILLEQPGHLTLSMRYRCFSPHDAQIALEKDKPLWRQTVIGDFAKILKRLTSSESAGVTNDAADQISEIDEAIAASRQGECFGSVSCVVIVRDRDFEQADERVHNLLGTLAGTGIQAVLETIGAEKAIRSTWPGHLIRKADEYEANRHRLKVTGQNFWDWAMPRKLWEGEPYITSNLYPPHTPTPMVCSGTAGEPFYYPTHDPSGVAHFLGIGTTGSGKSTWVHNFICALLSIPNMRVILMDSSLARASYTFAHLINAEYHEVGVRGSVPLCPLALLDTEDGLQWFMAWFERVFFRRREFELDENGSKILRNALMDVRGNHNWDGVTPPRHLRRLYVAIGEGGEQRSRMRNILDEMIEGYGHIFGGLPTDVGTSQVTIYQLANLNTVPKYIATPAKELILHNTIMRLGDYPAFCLWDEFWDAVGDDYSADWLFSSIRTMRGLNCGFGGLTQTSTEITNSKHCNVLLGNMPIRLFFPDSQAATPLIAASLQQMGLNPHEISRIAGASPGSFFYKSPAGSRLASNWLGKIGQAICAQTSYQAGSLAREILRECASPADFLQRWLQTQGLSDTLEGQALDGSGAGTVAA